MTNKTSIFKLIEIEYRDDNPQYPLFEVFRNTIGYFTSLEKAEQVMKEYTEEDCFGFLIEEYIIDQPSLWWAKSRRNYLPDGSFLDENLLSEMPQDETQFRGRPPEKLRFSNGDLVEVLWNDVVSLEIVTSTPCSPEKISEMQNPKLDFTDDSYSTIGKCGDNHSQPIAVNVFPPRFPVSDILRRQLRQAFLLDYIRKMVCKKLFFIKDIEHICKKLKFAS